MRFQFLIFHTYVKLESVSNCCIMPENSFQQYQGKNKLPQIDMSLHSDTLFCFQANQSLLLVLNDVCLA